MSDEIRHPEDYTWSYLRDFYYPRFRIGITQIPWEQRYDLLKTLYDNQSDDHWEGRTIDPIADMMSWAGRRGYWTFFSRGVTVRPDGSFTVHPIISRLLGRNGALGPSEGFVGDASESHSQDGDAPE
jgi:hypothetical protein